MLPDIPITPVVAKVQSSATDPVHAVLDSSTLNVNVVNTVQNTVPVNVQNQITLPNEYPITTSSSLSVTETNPIQLPSSYPITTSSPIDVNVNTTQQTPLYTSLTTDLKDLFKSTYIKVISNGLILWHEYIYHVKFGLSAQTTQVANNKIELYDTFRDDYPFRALFGEHYDLYQYFTYLKIDSITHPADDNEYNFLIVKLKSEESRLTTRCISVSNLLENTTPYKDYNIYGILSTNPQKTISPLIRITNYGGTGGFDIHFYYTGTSSSNYITCIIKTSLYVDVKKFFEAKHHQTDVNPYEKYDDWYEQEGPFF